MLAASSPPKCTALHAAPAVLLVLIVCLTAVRPGDGPWIDDEPKMMDLALANNARPCPRHYYGISLPFTPAPFGLKGTRGVKYGPFPIWIDQALLAFTKNVVLMAGIRALVTSGITAIALYWLGRTLEFSPWLAVVTMLSPWLWFYSRQLWDNSLCIPASALMLAAYGDFLRSSRARSLRLAVLCAVALVLTHFMALAIVVPVAMHAVFHFSKIWKFKWSVLLILAIAGFASRPYWADLVAHHHRDVPGGTSAWKGYFYPLLGAHHLSAMGLGNLLGEEWPSQLAAPFRCLYRSVKWISAVAYPLCWAGIVLALVPAWRAISRGQSATAKEELFLILLAIFAAQSALDGYEHVYEGPHYFNSTWIVYAVFVCLAADALIRLLNPRIQQIALPIMAAALLSTIALIAVAVARNSGIRSANYGTTLASQIEAAALIRQFSEDSPRDVQFSQWEDHPHALTVLLKLVPTPTADRPKRQVIIAYRNAWPADAAIAVESSPLR
jgi:hypothetical protein